MTAATSVPHGIEAAYREAVQRTGETSALVIARSRLLTLLKATPQEAEQIMSEMYQRMN